MHVYIIDTHTYIHIYVFTHTYYCPLTMSLLLCGSSGSEQHFIICTVVVMLSLGFKIWIWLCCFLTKWFWWSRLFLTFKMGITLIIIFTKMRLLELIRNSKKLYRQQIFYIKWMKTNTYFFLASLKRFKIGSHEISAYNTQLTHCPNKNLNLRNNKKAGRDSIVVEIFIYEPPHPYHIFLQLR